MHQTPQVAAVLLLLLAAGLQQTQAGVDWEWRVGRATNYGGAGDPWTIHYGSCGYYYLDPTRNKGWDVAALSDAVNDFSGSCGRCYEIRCNPMHLTDGYGTGLDRSHVCYDPSKTVTVMITDSCPCNYPTNYYSNKRWCCGDYYHFDLSFWTYEKLADKKWGVIGIQYRQVPCDYCPANPAQPPNWPASPSEGPPGDWNPDKDKRPYGKMCFKSSLEQDQGGNSGVDYNNGKGNDGKGNDGKGNGNNGGGSQATATATTTATADNNGGSRLSGSFIDGWADMSYNREATWSSSGADGTNGFCADLQGYGALAFEGKEGSLPGKKMLSFAVQKDNNGDVPDATVQLSSKKGSCRSINLRSITNREWKGDWVQLNVPVNRFDWNNANEDGPFNGCSGSIGAWDINLIEFKNKWSGNQKFCLSNVKML